MDSPSGSLAVRTTSGWRWRPLYVSSRKPVIEIVDHAMAAILRQKTEAERLRIGWGIWRSARAMLQNLVRATHPDWADVQVNAEVARRMSNGTR